MKQHHDGKGVKKYQKLELTIPSRYKDLVKPFVGKDLMVDVKRKDDRIVIEVKAVDEQNSLL